MQLHSCRNDTRPINPNNQWNCLFMLMLFLGDALKRTILCIYTYIHYMRNKSPPNISDHKYVDIGWHMAHWCKFMTCLRIKSVVTYYSECVWLLMCNEAHCQFCYWKKPLRTDVSRSRPLSRRCIRYIDVLNTRFAVSAAYMRQWIGSALVQMMACRRFGTKPLSKPTRVYCQLEP